MRIATCPLCHCKRLTLLLRRDEVPAHQNLVVGDPQEARFIKRGQLEMMVCEECGFVFNRSFDPDLPAYGQSYDNTQSCSLFFDAYLDELAKNLVEKCGVRNSTIVEVGCGKGHFLRKLVEYPGAENRGFGFDPSYAGLATDLDGRLHFRRCYYDDTCMDVVADIVVCRHVIEHVHHPMALLHAVRAALRNTSQARVFFETPCVEWILRNKVFWDFFYEHCSLFSPASLRLAFEQAKFAVRHVEHIFGGQYLWIEAQPVEKQISAEKELDQTVFSLARSYAEEESAILHQWRTRLLTLAARGKTCLWGAGAKGATLAYLLDPDKVLLDCVVDLNPNKQGRYIPGTGHPIVSPLELPERGVKHAVLMNPNYRIENQHILRKAGIELDLIDWSSA